MVGVCLALAACAANDATTGGVRQYGPSKCPCYACPCRSDAFIAVYRADILYSDGKANPYGLRIVRAEAPSENPPKLRAAAGGVPVLLDVNGDRLTASELAWPFRTLEGQALQGVSIWVASASDETFRLTIDRVSLDDLHFWEGDPDPVEGYEISYRRVVPKDPNGTVEYLCSGDGTATDPKWGGVPHAAILFDGDYIDDGKAVVRPAPPAMFNVGCPGSARASLHLSRHTAASDRTGAFPTTVDQRQTMWKMLRADYCGSGRSFTTDNYPVLWQDSTGWPQPPLDLDPKHGQITSIEAIWGPNGAVCVDTPRQVTRDKLTCQRPMCHDIDSWPSQGHVISANPVL